MYALLASLALATATECGDFESCRKVRESTWYLGMNLNPADGHIMDYLTGWADDTFIGTYNEALTKDYLNPMVWKHPANYIAIVRHQLGYVDAVKVFRFRKGGRSLLSRFQAMNPGRDIATEGGPIQESVSINALNMDDDPIFSVGGDLAFNWAYSNNGARIVLTGGYLSPANVNDDGTHGLGMHFACNPLSGEVTSTQNHNSWRHEISVIQGLYGYKVQGTDYGTASKYQSVPVHGNYAIYVSDDATSFPEPGYKLDIEVNVVGKYKFFSNDDK